MELEGLKATYAVKSCRNLIPMLPGAVIGAPGKWPVLEPSLDRGTTWAWNVIVRPCHHCCGIAKVPRKAALSAGFEADFFVTFAGVGARTQCARRRTGGTDQDCRGPGPHLTLFCACQHHVWWAMLRHVYYTFDVTCVRPRISS